MLEYNRPLPLSMKIPDAVEFLGIGRTKLYELISAGEIEAKKSGKNLLVLTASMLRYLENLPGAKIIDTRAAARRAARQAKQSEAA